MLRRPISAATSKSSRCTATRIGITLGHPPVIGGKERCFHRAAIGFRALGVDAIERGRG